MKFQSFIKDMNSAAKRVASGSKVLDNMTESELVTFYSKLKSYAPKTNNGISTQIRAIKIVEDFLGLNTELSEKQEAKTKEIEATFDAVAIGQEILDKSAILDIHIHSPGFDKVVNTKVALDKVRVAANPDYDPHAVEEAIISDNDEEIEKLDIRRLAVVQRTIDKKFLLPLITLRNEFWSSLKMRSVRSSILTNGRFLVPRTMILSVQERIDRFVHERNILIDEFETRYGEAKLDARRKLAEQYNEALYPSFDDIRARYGVTYRWVTNDVPNTLKSVSKDLWAAEQDKARDQWAETAQEIRDTLRQEFTSLVEHFADRLGVDEDTNKPKTFHAARITKLNEFLDTFADRNLTHDAELANIAKKAKDLVNDLSPKSLRKDQSLRDSLQLAFTKIKDEASKMVIVKGRKFNLSDD